MKTLPDATAPQPNLHGAAEPERQPRPDALCVALSVLDGRWTWRLVATLLNGPRSFSEMKSALPGLSANILTKRLRRLAAHGVVIHQATGEGGGRVRYALTDWGRNFRLVAEALDRWAERFPPDRTEGDPRESVSTAEGDSFVPPNELVLTHVLVTAN